MKIEKDKKELLKRLDNEETGEIIKKILEYEETGTIEKSNNNIVNYIIELMQKDIDKQKIISKKRSKSSKGKGRPRKENNNNE